MTRRRDLVLLLVLFVLLVVFVLLGPAQQEEDTGTNAPTTYSSQSGGALALWRWSRDLGYDARRLEYTDFDVQPETQALFILNPGFPITRFQAQQVLRWVAQGGTLVLVDDRSQLFGTDNQLLDLLEVDIVPYTGPNQETRLRTADVLQPVFGASPLATVPVNTSRVIDTERRDVARLLGTDSATVMLGIEREAGYIYLVSAVYPFTNEGLRDERNAAFVLNLLSRVPAGGRIVFDEYHHGFFEPPSMRSFLFETAWGWALIYSVGVLVLYLILTGRRFGQPVPLREETTRRSSAEYVESMANLFQRGGKRDYMLQHYHTMFKRRLAKPLGVNPRLDDEAFVQELARQGDLNADEQHRLRQVLQRLRQRNPGESDLLAAVAAADAIPTRR